MIERTFFLVVMLVAVFSFSCENEGDESTPNDPREEVTGTDPSGKVWNLKIEGEPNPIEIIIKKDEANSNGLILVQFDEVSVDVKATLKGLEIEIPTQQTPEGKIVGKGEIDSDYQSISFTWDNDNFKSSGTASPYDPSARKRSMDAVF